MKSLLFVALTALTACHAVPLDNQHDQGHGSDDAFVKISSDGKGFTLNGKPYLIRGANYWQGMNIGASDAQGGNVTRLETEIQQMAQMGINNLRIMGGSEGPDDQPYRMRPSLMPSPGKYNEDIFVGLDRTLDVMGKNNMTAVVTLGNFWQWSGGFGQYVAWVVQNETIPYPVGNVSYDEFTNYVAQFYNNSAIAPKASAMWKRHIRTVQGRVNTVNGKKYSDDPVIMSWEIANEPQTAPYEWFSDISSFIKRGAPKQLVTTGLESKLDEFDFNRAHDHKDIDYACCHCWVENWGIYNASVETDLPKAQQYMADFLTSRAQWAASIKKPILLEEFGMARDAWRNPSDLAYKYLPSTPTSHKDAYYKGAFDQIVEMARNQSMVGSNFWAYAGEGRSTDAPNKFNMTWLGDPPHEPHGWYSVYDNDTTVDIIKTYNSQLLQVQESLGN
ncbi:glycoside hydrolase superfamily [Gongronella butleri]|nr:glycoside hydrolase superfamily [Gongronella butleri]